MCHKAKARQPALPVALVLVATMLVAPGCVLGPDYTRPATSVPPTYRFATATAATGAAGSSLTDVPAWWRAFNDVELNSLVEQGLAANHDLRIATARVDEFAASAVAAGARGLPTVGYGANAARQHASRAGAPAGAGTVSDHYSALLNASWELDLWGRIRRENEAARATLLATEQARLGVALTLVSTIVSGYVTLLDLDRRLDIAQATLKGRKDHVDVFQLRLHGGAVSEFEMMQVTAEYETAAAAIPGLRQAIVEQEHALSALIGRNPGPIKRGRNLYSLGSLPVPAGLPSDLIARRPDILESEQQLVATNALLGAARALYFPSLSLTGSGGSSSRELDELLSRPAGTWSFTGQLLGPLFSGGAIDAANRKAHARREQALEAYQNAILTAFRDVDDALSAIQTSAALVASLERRASALQRAVGLARVRYDNGYSDYLSVLDTERSLFSAELALSTARGDGYRALVNLYRALGGDWVERIAPLPTPPHGHGSASTTPSI